MKRTTRGHSVRRAAFTFVELVVALLVLAAAVTPLVVMQATATGRARASQLEVMAVAMACETAEQLRTLPFAQLPMGQPFAFSVSATAPGTSQAVLPGAAGVPLLLGQYPLSARVEVLLEPLSPPDVLARMELVVKWTEAPPRGQQQLRHVELFENRAAAGGTEW